MAVNTPTASAKQEFDPILPQGMHRMGMAELKHLCVDSFQGSRTRTRIWGGLSFVIDKLLQYQVEADVWLNGSFLTKKQDPEDVDLVLCIKIEVYDQAPSEAKDAIDWINDNLKKVHFCDSYRFFMYPPSHKLHTVGEQLHAYWLDQFGTNYAGDEPKGIALIELRPKKKRIRP